jgi:hypothetical protein
MGIVQEILAEALARTVPVDGDSPARSGHGASASGHGCARRRTRRCTRCCARRR